MSTRGYGLMADIVIALASEPMTAKEVGAQFVGRMQIGPIRRLLRRLLDGKVLRISGWRGSKNAERLYSCSPGASVTAPVRRRINGTTPNPPRAPTKPATPMFVAERFCAIWQCLETVCTIEEICDVTGSSPGVVRTLVHKFRLARPKLVRIAGYELNAQRTVLFERSGKADASRPQIVSNRTRYVRAKQKATAMELHQTFSFFRPAQAQNQEEALAA